MSKQSEHRFKEFVDEHSPEEAMEIQRKWRKKAEQKRSSCFSRVMIAAIVCMVIIFVLMISFLAEGKKQHFELDYGDENYVYIQSVYPHLKLLMQRDQSTIQTRLVKALGILYPELIEWIEASLQPGMQVLLVPNELAGVNVLGVALGYYLRSSENGSLKILIDSPSYRLLTQANLDELRKQHGHNRYPVDIVSKSQYGDQTYDLIIIENNNFHQTISNFDETNLIIIRKEGAANSIIYDFFSEHGQYEIVKGLTNAQIREVDKWNGYAIIPYEPEEKNEMNIILLLAMNYPEVPLCPEEIRGFIHQQGSRNMVEYLRNKTFNQASIYYELRETDSAILDAIAGFKHVQQIYVPSQLGLGIHQKIIEVGGINNFTRSAENYYLIRPALIDTITLAKGDKILIKIQDEVDLKSVPAKYTKDKVKMSMILPFNNNGCFYPAQVVPCTGKFYPMPYFLLLESAISNPNEQN